MNECTILQKIDISFEYPVSFTHRLFAPDNPTFFETVMRKDSSRVHRLVFVADENVVSSHPGLLEQIGDYVGHHGRFLRTSTPPLVVPGGEKSKNSLQWVDEIQALIHETGLCRHSFVVAIGGGAVLDMAGFAASIPHRGLRFIRVPTTVLAQNDAGIGIKNGINHFCKKNFAGVFSPPFAVLNDFDFLATLEHRDWICGIAEALKVSLLKDADFFGYLRDHAEELVHRKMEVMQNVIYRCAELHLHHIRTCGDPFELGSSRPLDFGHWAAHKLESLSSYRLRHGEAVACGMALDCHYAMARGWLSEREFFAILDTLHRLSFELYQPEMEDPRLLEGLVEFREHLGGVLSVPMITGIGSKMEVSEIDPEGVRAAVSYLKKQKKVPIRLEKAKKA